MCKTSSDMAAEFEGIDEQSNLRQELSSVHEEYFSPRQVTDLDGGDWSIEDENEAEEVPVLHLPCLAGPLNSLELMGRMRRRVIPFQDSLWKAIRRMVSLA